GAHDYIMKNNLLRLVPAIERELREAEVRRDRRRAEEQLRKAYEELEIRVKERTSELAAANEELRREITERRQAEQASLESEAKYSALVEQANDGVFILQDETIEFANRALAEMSGCTVKELTGRSVLDLVAPESREEIIGLFRRLMEGERVSKLYEVKGLSKDGTPKDIEISAVLIDYHGRPAAVGIVRDITERKELEAKRLTESKLKSIGVLAGGIAHDFNNILTAVLGNLSLAKMYARPGEKIFERLEEAEKACLRARHLTQQMLVFSKGGTPVKKTVYLSKLLRDAATFAVHGSKTICRFDTAGDLWPAEVDEGQIGQVISNLVLNADQAMPGGGLIRVQAENAAVREGDIRALTSGNYVKITVEDQGTGIPEEHLTRIFDPYFTTKEKGSGLGLTTAYSIVKNHDGHIRVESKVGVGTTVYVYLPASLEAVPADEIEEGSPSENPLPGKGRVLIMDDEEMVREVAGEILTHMGYEVDYAKNGTEAIAVYQDAKWTGRPFDVLIMDLTIPGGMGGKEAVKKLLEIDPEARVIVSSGYSSDPIMSDFARYGFVGVIAKPYRIEDLSAVLYRTMAMPIRRRQER
ncbi:MAG: ATP-binding protein, partial [Pseudomonadota bacterium]